MKKQGMLTPAKYTLAQAKEIAARKAGKLGVNTQDLTNKYGTGN